MFLLGVGLVRLPLRVAPYLNGGADAIDVARPVLWAITLVLALAGRRRFAAGVAVAGAIVETVHVARWYSFSPTQVLLSSWLVTLALLVAVASVWLAGGARVAVPRGVWWFGAAVAVAVGGRFTDDQHQYRPFDLAVIYDGQFLFRFAAPLYLTAAGLALWAWWRLGGPVRRRVLALTAPVAGIAAMVAYGFAGFMYSSQRFPSPVLLIPVQWVVLLLTPPAAFALAAALVNRWERLSALVRLGRQAEDTAG
jgi:hypothetical protein